MILSIITFIVLGFLSATEETQQLIQRGSWRIVDYSVPTWGTDWKGFKRFFNSHHSVFGMFVLVMLILIYVFTIEQIWLIPIYWAVFFYIRNITMHVVFANKKIWWYWIPFYGLTK